MIFSQMPGLRKLSRMVFGLRRSSLLKSANIDPDNTIYLQCLYGYIVYYLISFFHLILMQIGVLILSSYNELYILSFHLMEHQTIYLAKIFLYVDHLFYQVVANYF